MPKRKAVVSIQECVACGCCMKVCPRTAISIPKGTYAETKICVLGAENVQRNVLQVLSHWR